VSVAAYTDGRGAFVTADRRIEPGSEIRHPRTIRVDACVIGSGAGGAVAAKELAEGGMSVALLEEGEWWETDAFTARPSQVSPKLYRDAAQTATIGTPAIGLPLGRGVGGTTLINSGTCFRTPEHVLDHWRADHGLDYDLDDHFARVEEILNVQDVPAEIAGRNADVVRRGVERLGWSGGFLRRNVRGCVGSGVCAFGCPTGAKQHVGISYVPRAWAAGAMTYTGCRARRIEVAGGRLTAVEADTTGGGRLRVECDHAVVACGAIHTPALLRRNGLGTTSGQLGRNLSIHPATAVRATMDEDVDMWRGVPQSYYVDEFTADGIILEGIAGPPDMIAMGLGVAGAAHRALMTDVRRLAQFGVMVSDTSRGRIRPVAGRSLVRYDVNREDVHRFHKGLQAVAEIFWAAGAREVHLPLKRLPKLVDGDSTPLERFGLRARDLELMAFHPLGTARAGADPARSVVDPDLRVHGVEGLHVADGSVVPSSLGVNPQITIMALATHMAFRLLSSGPARSPVPARRSGSGSPVR
jgi:choline dehydrogenase-like flavoprotein